MQKKMVYTIIVVILMVMSAVFAVALLTIEEDDDKDHIENVEASGYGITLGDVKHLPTEPSAGDHVDYFVEVEGLPSGYTLLLFSEGYNQTGTLRMGYRAPMYKVYGIKYRDTDVLNEDISGFTIKYKILVYDQDWREAENLYENYEPILESDLHTYVVK